MPDAQGDVAAEVADEQDARGQAIRRLKRKREFRINLVVYVFINAALWGIWALNGAETDDLWPAWVNGIWGFFLLLDAWHVYGERPISERDIQDEISRIQS